jgi:nucleotide-binding universal stress UspA family protein
MFKKILVTLENGPADKTILPHAKRLAKQFGSVLLLLHVADGWVARNFHQLKLAESEEMKEDRAYLERIAGELRAENMVVSAELALGNPPTEILRIAEREHCDLIAMASHGHRFLGDLFHGSTISGVRHKTAIPMLLARVPRK